MRTPEEERKRTLDKIAGMIRGNRFTKDEADYLTHILEISAVRGEHRKHESTITTETKELNSILSKALG